MNAPSFKDVLEHADLAGLAELGRCTDTQRVAELLRQPSIPQGARSFALLSSPAAAPLLEQLAARASTLTTQRHGRTIRFYAPAYISNECTNTCTYCGFTMENKIRRKTLSLDEMRHEGLHLHKRGFRSLLIVAGEHQKIVTPEFVAATVSSVRDLFPSIAIEVAPFRTQDYQMLVQAGVDGLTLYQETYNRSTYAAVHLRGKKRDYDYRLVGPERGAQAGMRRIALGVLLGLDADWRLDSATCALHLEYMMRSHWRAQYSISLPRLCSSETDYQPAVQVSDREIVQLVTAWRLAFPDVGINISTREPAYLRDGLIGLGVTHMSAESATDPGGYCNPNHELKQFNITDHRALEEIISIVTAKGHEAVWKDWDAALSLQPRL